MHVAFVAFETLNAWLPDHVCVCVRVARVHAMFGVRARPSVFKLLHFTV